MFWLARPRIHEFTSIKRERRSKDRKVNLMCQHSIVFSWFREQAYRFSRSIYLRLFLVFASLCFPSYSGHVCDVVVLVVMKMMCYAMDAFCFLHIGDVMAGWSGQDILLTGTPVLFVE